MVCKKEDRLPVVSKNTNDPSKTLSTQGRVLAQDGFVWMVSDLALMRRVPILMSRAGIVKLSW